MFCPNCKEHENYFVDRDTVEGDDLISGDDNTLYVDSECYKCKKTFTLVYTLDHANEI